jgi:antitoxin MazE
MAAKTTKRHKSAARAKRSGATPSVRRNTTVSKWGNSLGLRIPQEAAEQLNLRAGEQVTIEVRAGVIVVKPLRKKWTEAELLRGVTPEIGGGEIDTGNPVGKELW